MILWVREWSHWQRTVRKLFDGIVGVIYKATQGTSYTDDTYVNQQHAAKAAGLLWGAYHFAEATNVDQQVAKICICPLRRSEDP